MQELRVHAALSRLASRPGRVVVVGVRRTRRSGCSARESQIVAATALSGVVVMMAKPIANCREVGENARRQAIKIGAESTDPPHAPRRSTRFVTDHWAKKMAEGSTQIQQQKKKGKDLQTLNQPSVCFIATVVALSWLQSSLRSHRIDQDRSGHGLRWKASSSNSKSIATFRHGCG